jgi:hypothetical protein
MLNVWVTFKPGTGLKLTAARVLVHLGHLQPTKDRMDGHADVSPSSLMLFDRSEQAPEHEKIAGTHRLIR